MMFLCQAAESHGAHDDHADKHSTEHATGDHSEHSMDAHTEHAKEHATDEHSDHLDHSTEHSTEWASVHVTRPCLVPDLRNCGATRVSKECSSCASCALYSCCCWDLGWGMGFPHLSTIPHEARRRITPFVPVPCVFHVLKIVNAFVLFLFALLLESSHIL